MNRFIVVENKKEHLADVSMVSSINIPIFSELGLRKYADAAQSFKYYSQEDIGTVCTLFSTMRYRGWNFPNADTVRIVPIERAFYSSWAAKRMKDEMNTETFIEYASDISPVQREKLWKNAKMRMPVSVVCIPIRIESRSYSTAEHVIDEHVRKNIEKALNGSPFTKKARYKVGDTFVPSGNFYDNLQKYEKQAYEAFGYNPILHNSDFERIRPFSFADSSERFVCVPVFLQLIGTGIIPLDYFFSFQSELLQFNSDKVSAALTEVLPQCTLVGNYLIPGNAIMEFGRTRNYVDNKLSPLNQCICSVINYIQNTQDALYLDVKRRGNTTKVLSFNYLTKEDKLRAKTDLTALLRDEALQGGCMLCFLSIDQTNPAKIYGFAVDGIGEIQVVPAYYLREHYQPCFDNRQFPVMAFEYYDADNMIQFLNSK